MGKMNVFEILSLLTYVWSLIQLFCFNNWIHIIPVLLHLFIAKLFYFDDKSTKDSSTQMDEIAEFVMKVEVATSTQDIQNPYLNQSKIGNNPFINAMGDSENLLALTIKDSASESSIDEALTLWKPYAEANLRSNIYNPFLNPFFDMLKLEDPLALFDEGSEDGQQACENWVARHQDLFLTQTDPDP